MLVSRQSLFPRGTYTHLTQNVDQNLISKKNAAPEWKVWCKTKTKTRSKGAKKEVEEKHEHLF